VFFLLLEREKKKGLNFPLRSCYRHTTAIRAMCCYEEACISGFAWGQRPVNSRFQREGRDRSLCLTPCLEIGRICPLDIQPSSSLVGERIRL
jgi:hypothetical protein